MLVLVLELGVELGVDVVDIESTVVDDAEGEVEEIEGEVEVANVCPTVSFTNARQAKLEYARVLHSHSKSKALLRRRRKMKQ